MSSYGLFGVDPQRKEHPAIKSGKKELGDAPSSLNSHKIDGQRLFMGPGTAGMGVKPRNKTQTMSVNHAAGGTFRVRKRTLKG